MKKWIIISLFVIFTISLNFMLYIQFSNKEIKEEIMNSEQFNETIILEEQTNEMEENKNETISNVVESSESVSNSSSNRNNVSNKNNKKNDNTRSSNTVKNDNSKVQENKTVATSQPEIKEEQKEEKEKTSESVQVVKEEPKETSIEEDPIYIRMKKELFSSISECNNKGMEVNLKDMDNIASTMCSSESYKGVEVGFRLYIRYNDGTYKEYKK